jgi:hypothetical protein
MKWLSLFSVILLVVACFMPWVVIESREISLSGINAFNYGKPAYMHFFFAFCYAVFLFVPRSWAQFVSVFMAAFNLAWAVTNFLRVSACEAADCPDKQIGLYLLVISAFLMLLTALLIRQKTPAEA